MWTNKRIVFLNINVTLGNENKNIFCINKHVHIINASLLVIFKKFMHVRLAREDNFEDPQSGLLQGPFNRTSREYHAKTNRSFWTKNEYILTARYI